MQSKVMRNVEVLHTVGEFLPKISVNYVYGLCVVLLLMHFISWVFPIYVVSIYLLLLCINLYICRDLSIN